jgi:hypothetical protein
MIDYWRKDDLEKNFGDFLTELLLDLFDAPSRQHMVESRDDTFHLIGSVIFDFWIRRANDQGSVAVFWGCGSRDRRLHFDASHYRLHGVRGTSTKTFLGAQSPAIGDPGLACPILIPPPEQAGAGKEILLMPHFQDPAFSDRPRAAESLKTVLAGEPATLLLPTVRNRIELESAVRRLAASSFVLAGAMHAAVVALAYGVPFAFYRTSSEGYVDCPVKWHDLASLHGFVPQFVSSVEEGRTWYRSIEGSLTHPSLERMLAVAPGRVKPTCLELARQIDRDRTQTSGTIPPPSGRG